MVISDSFIREVESVLLNDSFYTLTRLDAAAELCEKGDAPFSAAIYRRVMRERVAQLFNEEKE